MILYNHCINLFYKNRLEKILRDHLKRDTFVQNLLFFQNRKVKSLKWCNSETYIDAIIHSHSGDNFSELNFFLLWYLLSFILTCSQIKLCVLSGCVLRLLLFHLFCPQKPKTIRLRNSCNCIICAVIFSENL